MTSNPLRYALVAAILGAAGYGLYQSFRPQHDLDPSPLIAKLASCGIVLETPTIVLSDRVDGHGGAVVRGWQVRVAQSAYEADRRFVEEELLPHELAHLAHYAVYGTTSPDHPPRFKALEDFLRGVTTDCPEAR